MVINVIDVTSDTVSNEQGDHLNLVIRSALRSVDNVQVSFKGVIHVTSSFINWSFGALRDEYSIIEIKRRVRISHVSPAVKKMIVVCFSSYEKQNKKPLSV